MFMQNQSAAPVANSVADACKRLGVGRSTMYELIKGGDLKAIKVCSRTLIPESELLRFVAAKMETAQP